MKPTAESVKVVVRCRPINEKETQDGHTRIVQVWTDRGVIEIHNPKGQAADPPKPFTFDSVYDWNCHQIDIYEETFRPLVDSVLQGYNGTIFAYGQTGTGKTYTMEGIKESPEKRGLIPNSFEHIFSHISQSRNTQFLVRASYLEIYQEHIRDLLAKDQKKRLELKERPDTGVYVKDLSSFVCKSVKEIDHVMNVGNQNRSVGATNMNEHSSRSHAIFIVTVEACDLQNHGQSQGGRVPIRVGKLNLVDLAGSERQAKTGATGDRLKEATKINLSLSALGNVISALVDGKSSHIPYRDSKLTRLLQDSLGGNSRTVMVANVGPASYNYEETLTTLRYAHRAKSIKNAPHINEDPKDALLREFQQEIARLKAHVADKKKKRGRRRKRHKGGDELEEAEETEETEEEDEKDVEKDIREQEAKLEAERAAIVGNEQLITEEKERLLKALQEKELELQKQRQNQEKLASRIKALESKLLMGGVNMDLEGDNSKSIIEHTNEQQRALEQRRQEIMERKRLEREIQQKLEAQEEETSDLRETFGSLQQEVDVKTKKLKKLYAKWQAARQDVADLSDEFARERRELEEAQEALTKELKLKYLIMDNFIPPVFRHQIISRAYFDEDEDAFKLRPFSQSSAHPLPRPKATAQAPRPSTEYERLMIQSSLNPSELYRFKAENVLVLELDLPMPTTGPYAAPTVSPSLQEALHRAMEAHSTPMEVGCHSAPAVKDVRAFLKSAASKQRRAATARSRSAHSSRHGHTPLQPHHPQSDTPDGAITFARMYPQPRGLVPK